LSSAADSVSGCAALLKAFDEFRTGGVTAPGYTPNRIACSFYLMHHHGICITSTMFSTNIFFYKT
jgi:hypothetical protein